MVGDTPVATQEAGLYSHSYYIWTVNDILVESCPLRHRSSAVFQCTTGMQVCTNPCEHVYDNKNMHIK